MRRNVGGRISVKGPRGRVGGIWITMFIQAARIPRFAILIGMLSCDRMVAAILWAAVLGAAACDEGARPTGPSGTDVVGLIENNHGHTATVRGGQIAEARALRLDIRGTANHGHLLEMTDDNMQQLQRRERVEVTSSLENNHRHRVTFN